MKNFLKNIKINRLFRSKDWPDMPANLRGPVFISESISVPRWAVAVYCLFMLSVTCTQILISSSIKEIKQEIVMLQGCEMHD